MGAALATHLARAGNETAVLATELDGAVVRAWHADAPHPALGVALPREVTLLEPAGWNPE